MVSKFPPLTVGMSTKEAIELVKADKTLTPKAKENTLFRLRTDASDEIDDPTELQLIQSVMRGENHVIQKVKMPERTNDWKDYSSEDAHERLYEGKDFKISFWTPNNKPPKNELHYDNSPNSYQIGAEDNKIVGKTTFKLYPMSAGKVKEEVIDENPYDGIPEEKLIYDRDGKVKEHYTLDANGVWQLK